MASERRSPTFFRHRAAAVTFFAIAAVLLTAGAYAGVNLLTRHDYSGALPEDASLRVRLADAETGYVVTAPEETPAAPLTRTARRYAAAPEATPIPIEMYALQDTRMVMPPAASTVPCQGELTKVTISAADGSKTVMATGWAYLDGADAQRSKIYLAVSSQNAAINRFYEVTVLPGSSGVSHESEGGQNLERADFRAVFSVRFFEDGAYRLGALVVGEDGAQGFVDYGAAHAFSVKGNAVTDVGA